MDDSKTDRRTLVVMQVHNNRYYGDGQTQFDDPLNLEILEDNIRLLDSHFGRVVLVAPNASENTIFRKVNGCTCFLGYKDDAGKRICEALRQCEDRDVVIRTFAEQKLDLGIVRDQVDVVLRDEADYVSPPEGPWYRHGAEVFTLKALRRTVERIDQQGLQEHRMRPYFLMRNLDFIRWAALDSSKPRCPAIQTAEVTRKPGIFQTEILDHYRFIRDQCTSGDCALELGCGNGEGGSIVGQKVREYLGVDLASMNIAYAKEHYESRNVKFVRADALEFRPSKSYDRVLCLFVLPCMRGLVEERKLIETTGRCLRPGGMAYFSTTIWGWHEDGKMRLSLFRTLLSGCFRDVEIRGLDKGFFVAEEAARESAFAICRDSVDA